MLDTDASQGKIGCALLQLDADGDTLHPVGYWSRTLNDAERNYSTTERECLAVVWAVLLLRAYLEGRKFTVRTDHNSLRWILNMTSAEGRLARWRLRLAEFEFDVEYKKGKRHVIADALSRMATRSGDETEIPDEIPCFDAANIVEPHADAYARADTALLCDYAEYYPSLDCLLATRSCIEPPVSSDEWIREQATDEFCQNAKRDVETAPQSRFHLSPDGILMRTAPLDGATQIVVPEAIRGAFCELTITR